MCGSGVHGPLTELPVCHPGKCVSSSVGENNVKTVKNKGVVRWDWN